MGKLFVFSGIDGAGKTTVIWYLYHELINLSIPTAVFNNHEPFSAYWNFIKRIRKTCETKGTDFSYELDRFLQVLELGIKTEDTLPLLLKNFAAVLSDRYIWDKLVYGKLRGNMGIAETALEAINHRPDLTFFLEVSPDCRDENPERKRRSHRLERDSGNASGS